MYFRTEDGRFSVRLPLKVNHSEIRRNKGRALQALFCIENQNHHDSETWKTYVEFMREYEALGHMSLVQESEIGQRVCYIPHQAVIRSDTVTTKLHVVFNASASDGARISLNEL